jgi:Putative esterase
VKRRFALLTVGALAIALPAADAQSIDVAIAPSAHAGPVTGRLIVFIAKDSTPEPRFRLSVTGPALFGLDISELPANHAVAVTDSADGYPTALSALPPGDYFAQAMVNVYEQVHRADGHVIWVHMNDGTVEFFNTAAGNLYGPVQRIHIGERGAVHLMITQVIPPKPRPADTEWLKHVRIQSERLTRFWGRPVYINATVLLPKGYAEHPTTYYPSVYPLGHGREPFGFTPDSTDKLSGPTEVRRGATIGVVSGLESGYDFYRSWTGDGFPRVIAITLEQQTPYFPDSYSVNSVNNGPYGDAIIEEVLPYLETHFRIIRKPYARHIEGASTSGWQTLALALQHPDVFGGAWVLQPDPIDFRHYQQTNAYEDTNAFVVATGPFTTTERPFQRTTTGQVVATMRQLSGFESVLGSHGRSGYQLEAWEAIHGPIGTDGYPIPLWDKRTGTIDHTVATYMRDHGFDLRDYAERNWSTLGPKLAGKLHFFAGDMDNYYLNLAVYDFETFLQHTTAPHADADFTYGRPMKGHGWHSYTWAELVRMMAAATTAHAPAGEDVRGWNY